MGVRGFSGANTQGQYADIWARGTNCVFDTGTKRSGSASFKNTYDNTNPEGFRFIDFDSPVDQSTVRFYARNSTRLGSGKTVYIYTVELSSLMWVKLNDDGTLTAHVVGTSDVTSTATAAISTTVWWRIEISANSVSGQLVVRMYDDSGVLQETLNITGNNIGQHSRIGIGGDLSTAQDGGSGILHIDDAILYDDATWPGAGQNAVVPVVQNGTYTAWTGDYTAVDDAIPTPDDADYVSSSTALAKESWRPDTAANLGITGVINAVQAIVRAGAGSGAGGVRTLVRIQGADNFAPGYVYPGGSAIWLTTNTNGIIIVMGPFTKAEWDAVEIGGEHDNNSNAERMQTAWVGVDYKPATVGTWNASLDFIVGNYALQPSAGEDAHIFDGAATTNYGTLNHIKVGKSGGKSGGIYRTLINFDVSGIAAGATIRQSRLCVAVGGYNAGADDATVSQLLRAWVEAEATWNIWKAANNWTTAGADSDGNDYTSTSPNEQTTSSLVEAVDLDYFDYLDCKNIVEDGYDNESGSVKMRIKGPAGESASKTRHWRSSDYATARLRPCLVVQYDEFILVPQQLPDPVRRRREVIPYHHH